MQYACNRAECVDRDGEGSTGPSRGEHRLTVYRAHASFDFSRNLSGSFEGDSGTDREQLEVFLKSLECFQTSLRRSEKIGKIKSKNSQETFKINPK